MAAVAAHKAGGMNTQPAVRRAIERVADAVRAAAPDARVEVRPDGISIDGHRLRERLRWIGGLLR